MAVSANYLKGLINSHSKDKTPFPSFNKYWGTGSKRKAKGMTGGCCKFRQQPIELCRNSPEKLARRRARPESSRGVSRAPLGAVVHPAEKAPSSTTPPSIAASTDAAMDGGVALYLINRGVRAFQALTAAATLGTRSTARLFAEWLLAGYILLKIINIGWVVEILVKFARLNSATATMTAAADAS